MLLSNLSSFSQSFDEVFNLVPYLHKVKVYERLSDLKWNSLDIFDEKWEISVDEEGASNGYFLYVDSNIYGSNYIIRNIAYNNNNVFIIRDKLDFLTNKEAILFFKNIESYFKKLGYSFIARSFPKNKLTGEEISDKVTLYLNQNDYMNHRGKCQRVELELIYKKILINGVSTDRPIVIIHFSGYENSSSSRNRSEDIYSLQRN